MSNTIQNNNLVTGTARFQAALQLTCTLLISRSGKRMPTGDIAEGAALGVVEFFHEQLQSFDLEMRITHRASTETH